MKNISSVVHNIKKLVISLYNQLVCYLYKKISIKHLSKNNTNYYNNKNNALEAKKTTNITVIGCNVKKVKVKKHIQN